MSDHSKFTQLTAGEIDRLLTDSPLPIRGNDNSAAITTQIAPKIILTQEDLALLDESSVNEQSSQDVETGQSKDVVPETTPKSRQTLASCAPEMLDDNSFQSPFFGRASSPPLLPIHGNPDEQSSTTHERSSLSKLVHGWSTLMGHPITGSVSSQLSVSSQPIPIFSPLITQSSKLLTGVVSSLLSPWAMASKSLVEKSYHNHADEGMFVQDRLCDDSLINAFEKIIVTDSNSEHEDMFFSPNREREGTAITRDASTTPLSIVHLRSATMEDTQCEPHTESSLYSDAVSAQPSPMRSAHDAKKLSSSPSTLLFSSHPLANEDIVSPTPMTPVPETKSSFSNELEYCFSRLTPTVLSGNAESKDALQINAQLTENCSFFERDISPKVLFGEPGISECTFNHEKSSQEAIGFAVNTISQNVDAAIPAKCNAICREDSAASMNISQSHVSPFQQSLSKSRIPCSPFPMMVSMQNDDEWNRSRKSGGSSVSIDSRRKSKPTSNAERSESRIELHQEVKGLSKAISPEITDTSRRVARKETPFLHPSGSTRSSMPRSIIVETEAPTNPRRHTPDLLTSTHCSAKFNTPQQPSPDIASMKSDQEDKENMSPGTPAIVARRSTTHRSSVLSVTTEQAQASRYLAHKSKTQVSYPIEEEGVVEEKSRLRQEIKLLKANENILREVLSKYTMAFEEAFDQRSQVYFATSSAKVQVSDEICETRRLAATLHNAVLDSQRRHERVREAIEKGRVKQEEWLKRVEDLKEKYIHQSEKGLTYQKYCLTKIQRAIESMEIRKAEMEKELSKLHVQSKQLKIKQESLESELEQKTKENRELTRICDSLLK